MAASKGYLARQNYRFLTATQAHASPPPSHDAFELDESDLYGTSNSPEFRKSVPNRISKKSSTVARRGGDSSAAAAVAAASLPVNIPDWSKILKEEYRDNRRRDVEDGGDYDEDDDGEDFLDGGGVRVPPHEFLARTRIASFSVHEGIGRTLKGRDLSRVRNAIWEKTGFQD